MKIGLQCWKCARETGRGIESVAELAESGIYPMRCPHGTVVILQMQKFELLFELGIHAIIDGYYREGVSSFASALERFGEFYVDVFCDKRSIDVEQASKAWKLIARQSERQLGAFSLAYLTDVGEPLPYLKSQHVEFRNKVIHQGYFPSREETVTFGNSVAKVIETVLLRLKADAQSSIDSVKARHFAQRTNAASGPSNPQWLWINTMVNLNHADGEWETIEKWMLFVEQVRPSLYMIHKSTPETP